MKLTIAELGEVYPKNGKNFQTVTLESEPVVTVSGNNYFSLQQRRIVKTLEASVVPVLFGEGAAKGSVLNGWSIRQRHTFVPDQSIAQEIAKDIKKPQLPSFSAKTGKMYLTDGKLFFSKYELVREGKDSLDDIFDNITSAPLIDSLANGQRPTQEELAAYSQATGVSVSYDQSTLDKLNAAAPTVATAADPVRAAAANQI